MTAVRPAPSGSGYVLSCPDGSRRHGGLFATDRAARHWAGRRRCCTQPGAHQVTYRRGASQLRRLAGQGWA